MTKIKYERIKKFNSGASAILCSKCYVILKEGREGNAWAEEVHKMRGTYPQGLITPADLESTEPLFCNDCREELKL